MRNSICNYLALLIFFGGVFFSKKISYAQKSKYEAYIGTKFNLDDYNKHDNKSPCNSGKLSIVPFNQADELWADDIMVDPYTIGSAGCAMTCMAMLLHAHGQSVTPQTLNTYLIQDSGYTSNGSILWDVAGDFGTSSVGNVEFSNFDYTLIRTLLEDSNPVIIQVDMDDPNQSHFVIITGYEDGGDEPKDYYIIDPSGGNDRRLSVFEDDCQAGYNNLRIFSDVNATCILDDLPDHCFNCLWEPWLGETDVDCGGECPPCYKADYSSTITNNSETGEEIVATGYVTIEPLNNSEIDLSNTTAIKAGNEIILKNNTSIPLGSNTILKSTKNSNELTRDCDEPCIAVPNYYNKSINPILFVNVSSIEHIQYILFDEYYGVVDEFNGIIDYDGKIFLFELPPVGVYFSVSWYYACTGEEHYVESSVSVFEGDIDTKTTRQKYTNNTEAINNKLICHLYPNPTTSTINIEFLNPLIDDIEITITNMFGKINYVHFDKSKQPIVVALTPLPKGIYLLTIKTNERVFTEKVVLQ